MDHNHSHYTTAVRISHADYARLISLRLSVQYMLGKLVPMSDILHMVLCKALNSKKVRVSIRWDSDEQRMRIRFP